MIRPDQAATPSETSAERRAATRRMRRSPIPDARLYRKSQGQPSRLCYMGHLLIENRHGLIVDVRTTHATGRAEREAAEAMLAGPARGRRITVGGV